MTLLNSYQKSSITIEFYLLVYTVVKVKLQTQHHDGIIANNQASHCFFISLL